YSADETFFLAADAPHALPFGRASDGAQVDLHRLLHGTETVGPTRVWRAISAGSERMTVGGVETDVPGPAARTLHLVLGISPGDETGSRAAAHVQQAVRTLPPELWEQAAALARSLGIAAEFGHRLTRMPETADLARILSLPTTEPPLHASMRLAGSDNINGVHSVLVFAAQRTWRGRAGYARSKLLPPRHFLVQRYPFATRSAGALTIVRVRWLAKCLMGSPGAIRAWRGVAAANSRRS
ncbi:MAG: hypothetical protein JWP18_2229, partial [Solirubrobacterales bacterium]|nr:hypothetical protein [Solirubrobacterales bacterium]